jgi:hypothetical protein
MEVIMKSLFTLCFLMAALLLSAATLTVDNNNPSAGQYATIQAAIDAASNDDVIQVFPSNAAYAGFTCAKRLSIYGVGWDPGMSVGNSVSRTSIIQNASVTFANGSASSILSGFGGQFIVVMNANNIVLEGCQLNYVDTQFGTNQLIRGCWFSGPGTASPYYNTILTSSSCSSTIECNNCLFTGGYRVFMYPSPSIVFNNNISTMPGLLISYSSPSICIVMKNNYIMNSRYDGGAGFNGYRFPDSPSVSNNIFPDTTGIYTGYGNQSGKAFNTVFDSSYHLISGSPAINAGDPDVGFNDLDGTRNDIGIFGGPTPFHEGGTTTLPTIREMSGTFVTSPDAGLQIHVRATSEK